MNLEVIKKFANDWIAAWNSHDLNAIMSHYDDQIVFDSPYIKNLKVNDNGTITDKQSLRCYFEIALKNYPDLHFELISCLTGLKSVVLFYKSINELHSAEFMQLSEAGKIS